MNRCFLFAACISLALSPTVQSKTQDPPKPDRVVSSAPSSPETVSGNCWDLGADDGAWHKAVQAALNQARDVDFPEWATQAAGSGEAEWNRMIQRVLASFTNDLPLWAQAVSNAEDAEWKAALAAHMPQVVDEFPTTADLLARANRECDCWRTQSLLEPVPYTPFYEPEWKQEMWSAELPESMLEVEWDPFMEASPYPEFIDTGYSNKVIVDPCCWCEHNTAIHWSDHRETTW